MSRHRWPVVLVVGLLLTHGALRATPPGGKSAPRPGIADDPLPDGALARLGTLRLRHEGETFASFSPDGKQIISLGADNALRVWSATDGRPLHSFSPPGLKFSGTRGEITERMALRIQMLQMAQLGNGMAVQMFRQRLGGGAPAAYSADGRWLAGAGPKKGVSVWNTMAGMQPQHLEGQQVVSLAFSPDGRLLAAGELEGETLSVRVWDRAAGRPLWRLKIPAGYVPHSLRFSPDGKYLAGQGQNFVRLWSMTTGKRVRYYETQQPMLGIAFSPDSQHVAALTADHSATVWETASEEEVGNFTVADSPLCCACFSADGTSLFTWSADGQFKLWDWRHGLALRNWAGPSAGVQSLALTPDGKTLAAATAEGAISLWDVAAGKEVGPPRRPEVRALAFAAPETLFLLTAEGEAQWVEWAGGKVRRRAGKPSPKQTFFGAHANANVLALAEENGLALVHAESGKTLAMVDGLEGLTGLAFSPDGRRAALARGDETVRLWSLPAGRETRQLETGAAAQLAFSHDGKVLAVLGADQEVQLWELATGEQRCRFRATQAEVHALAFTPDDRHLVAACGDESVHVWDVLTGKRVRSLVGHFGPIEALAVSPDSRRLASGGADGVVLVWDLASGARQRRLEGHRGPINALAFSADGKRLASASKDTTVLVWDLTAAPRKAAAVPGRPAERHWEDLGRTDATVAFRAMTELIGAPEDTVALFRARLAPAAPVSAERIEALIANLSNEKYAVREKATRELARLEGRARRYVLKALAAKLEGEASRRLHQLADLLDAPAREPDALRAQRAVEVLERIGTPAALALLDEWAHGAPGARLTESAEEAGLRVRARQRVTTP
jgi:WD40 repeat protein